MRCVSSYAIKNEVFVSNYTVKIKVALVNFLYGGKMRCGCWSIILYSMNTYYVFFFLPARSRVETYIRDQAIIIPL